jgi:hypothetical protein
MPMIEKSLSLDEFKAILKNDLENEKDKDFLIGFKHHKLSYEHFRLYLGSGIREHEDVLSIHKRCAKREVKKD